MQIVKNSIVMRLFRVLYIYYNNSYAKQIALKFVNAYKESIIGRMFASVANRESAMTGSFFIRIIRKIFKSIDRMVTWVSKTISSGADTSLIVNLFKGIRNAVSGKAVALVLPLFGMGYALGRVIQGKLMLRDMLFLGLVFIAGAILMVDSGKRKAVLENSIVYKAYKLILE
ncbi:MAG: hypothetical protein PHC69_03745 [Ruminiclostridium sp.]|nr:hypothetical protein [Ruminiclostridium sp.]